MASPVIDGSEFIYLNGLLQMPGDDYTTVLNNTTGNIDAIEFTYDPENGRVQAAGQVVA